VANHNGAKGPTKSKRNFVSKKNEIDSAQIHMNDVIKEFDNKGINPLAFRFKKISNIQVSLTIHYFSLIFK
jgi:hypothetical protein